MFSWTLLLLFYIQTIHGRQHGSSITSAFTRNAPMTQNQAFHKSFGSYNNQAVVAQHKQSNFMGSRMQFRSPLVLKKRVPNARQSSTSLGMSFLGNDGFFGIGAPEIAVTLLVGYFILGPSDLYKLVKEIGKTFNTFREASAEASKQFNESIENTIELDELRKTQRELMNLNDAFSFRRSINVDEESDPFENKKVEGFADPRSGVVGGTVEEVVSKKTNVNKKRKKVRRRKVKKKVVEEESMPQPVAASAAGTAATTEGTVQSGNVEDLSMSDAFETPEEQAAWEAEMTAIQNTRKERLENSGAADWFTASEESIAEEVLSQQQLQQSPTTMMEQEGMTTQSSFAASEEQARFASQLAGNWNEQILQNEEKLSPLSKIMERLAILEEEKNAATMRLEEEFRLREELEEKFYREKRSVLEEAAAEVQAAAYIGLEESTTIQEEKNGANLEASKEKATAEETVEEKPVEANDKEETETVSQQGEDVEEKSEPEITGEKLETDGKKEPEIETKEETVKQS